MAKKEKPGFDPEDHERMVRKLHSEAPGRNIREELKAEEYARTARFDAFDALVDMALDGVITMADAKTAWESELTVYDGEDGA